MFDFFENCLICRSMFSSIKDLISSCKVFSCFLLNTFAGLQSWDLIRLTVIKSVPLTSPGSLSWACSIKGVGERNYSVYSLPVQAPMLFSLSFTRSFIVERLCNLIYLRIEDYHCFQLRRWCSTVDIIEFQSIQEKVRHHMVTVPKHLQAFWSTSIIKLKLGPHYPRAAWM